MLHNSTAIVASHVLTVLIEIIIKYVRKISLPSFSNLSLIGSYFYFKYGNKKDVGEHLQLVPLDQAFALPFHRDKQLSQPTPLGIIYNVCCRPFGLHTYGYNTPARTLCCEIFWWIKFAKFDIVEDNVQKRPFMLLTPARFTTPIVAAEAYSNKYLTRPPRWDWLSQAQS